MTNILLEFKNDEIEISKDILSLENEGDDAVILLTYFVMPVRFASAKVDFFELNGDFWLDIPLLHFATNGFDQVIKSSKGIRTKYYIPDIGHQLIFEKIEDQIKIISTLNNHSDFVNERELLESFRLFVTTIKKFLLEYVPEISMHDYWNEWLKN